MSNAAAPAPDVNSAAKTIALEADRACIAYLNSRGFTKASQELQNQAARTIGFGSFDPNAAMTVLGIKQKEEATNFEMSYNELRDWVDGSLDLYKAELHSVLYPMLVHCFLEIVRRGFIDRARAFLEKCGAEFLDGAVGLREEIIALAGIASEVHIEENKTAKLFLENRYEIQLSAYAKELVFSFLHDDQRRAVLLRILNQRCHVSESSDSGVKTSAGGIARGPANGKSDGFVTSAEKSGLLRHELLWGRLPPNLYMIQDQHEREAAEAAKADDDGSAADGPTPMTGVTAANGAPAGAAGGASDSAKKDSGKKDSGKKESAKKDSAKENKDAKADSKDDPNEEPRVLEDGTISVSRIPLKQYRPRAPGLETEQDIKSRATLGWQTKTLDADPEKGELSEDCTLPSVLCYTFANTKGEALNCSAVSADGAQVVGGFGDSSVRLWDSRVSGTAGSSAGAGLGSRPARLVGHAGPVYSVHWTRCGRFVLSGSEDSTVRLWSALHRTDIVAYRGHNFPVWSVRFSPLDHYFATGGHDRTARIWSTDHVYPLRIFAGHLADVDVVRWHPNCNYLATGSSDRTARLWDVRDGKCVRVFGARATVHALAFSPDGKKLAIAGDDPTIDVWDIRYAKKAQELAAHHSTVWALEYSLEGAILASGSADRSVGLWDTQRGDPKPLAKLRTKETPVHELTFTRRNLLVASGNFSGSV